MSGFRCEFGLIAGERRVVIAVGCFQAIGLFVGIGWVPSCLRIFCFWCFIRPVTSFEKNTKYFLLGMFMNYSKIRFRGRNPIKVGESSDTRSMDYLV